MSNELRSNDCQLVEKSLEMTQKVLHSPQRLNPAKGPFEVEGLVTCCLSFKLQVLEGP